MKTAKTMFWLGLVMLLIGFGPLISGMIAMQLASANGCELNEAYANTCMILGADWSETLYTMTVGIWFMFFTFWLILIGAILWIVALVSWLKNRGQSGT
jgi:hypothetical protein